MQFALLGDHEDGLAMARALAASERHTLRCYSGPAVGAEYLRGWGLTVPNVPDLEEVLADPAVEAVIVAGTPANRALQLRRALQSERHVLCVHPADQRADTAYEAASIQRETGRVLLPLLPETHHPALDRLAKLIAADRDAPGKSEHVVASEYLTGRAAASKPVTVQETHIRPARANLTTLPENLRESAFESVPRLLELERWATEAVLLDANTLGHEPGLPGWDMLRVLAGEIVEIFAFGSHEDIRPDEPILLAGRFDRGGLFHVTLIPDQPRALLRLSVLLRFHRAELVFPDGWPAPARLTWVDETGAPREEQWDAWDPWPRLVELFEQALASRQAGTAQPDKSSRPATEVREPLSWEDEIRCLELDDAARRSLERRRSSTLEFQEDFEEATFKGTMTLMGCSLLWISLFLLILSRWVPWLGWLILPFFLVFLVLQLLRWVVPTPPKQPQGDDTKSGER
jgi:hypothetical protein